MKSGQSLLAGALGASLLLSGCGGEPVSDAATIAAAGASAVSSTSAVAGCANGTPLPITRLCNNADPALFLATDQKIETFAAGCLWRTEELAINRSEVLIFRSQDCTAEGWVRNVYSFVSGHVKHRMDGTPDDQGSFALEIFPLAGETPEQAAMKTLDKAPETERSRCETHAITGHTLAGRPFELGPNAELKTELEAQNPNDPYNACGPNGMTMESVQFWEARPSHALFHMTGQDTPPWDPASFTFYRKDAAGKWAKVS